MALGRTRWTTGGRRELNSGDCNGNHQLDVLTIQRFAFTVWIGMAQHEDKEHLRVAYDMQLANVG